MSNFWETKKLEDFSLEEWESICDHCGLCCLHKLVDESTDEIEYTSVVCEHLNLGTCQCTVYADRNKLRPDCLPITMSEIAMVGMLPSTCGYLRLYKNQELPEWHPLLTGKLDSAVTSGNSVGEVSTPQKDADMDDLEEYILEKKIN